MIQIINYSGERNNGFKECRSIKFTSICKPQSLDEFQINIIDLRDERLWRNDGKNPSSIENLNDLKSLRVMLINATKSINIIQFPQDCVFLYHTIGDDYIKSIRLKDMLNELRYHILSEIHPCVAEVEINYENTSTIISKNNINASFYFNNQYDVLTYSVESQKATTLDFRGISNLILTTLNLDTYEDVMSFLKEIKLLEEKEEEPEWMKTFNMFDDDKQLSIIEENNKIIEESNENIDNALNLINKNKEYKSILYTNGDELVKVVFKILEEMMQCDLSGFKDKKKEDFAFVIENKHFVGEIKGVNSNVRSEHVSQLDVHYQSYLETNSLNDDVCALLIMNHQRNKPLIDREPVHEIQINLAKRNRSLIIETITLLRLFEKYKNNEIETPECIDILFNRSGLLEL